LPRYAEDAFITQRFLSPELEKFRAALRGIPAYRAWFEFGDDLNRLGHEMLDGLDVPFDDNQRLTIAGSFANHYARAGCTRAFSQ
jgi:hypothetical protein